MDASYEEMARKLQNASSLSALRTASDGIKFKLSIQTPQTSVASRMCRLCEQKAAEFVSEGCAADHDVLVSLAYVYEVLSASRTMQAECQASTVRNDNSACISERPPQFRCARNFSMNMPSFFFSLSLCKEHEQRSKKCSVALVGAPDIHDRRSSAQDSRRHDPNELSEYSGDIADVPINLVHHSRQDEIDAIEAVLTGTNAGDLQEALCTALTKTLLDTSHTGTAPAPAASTTRSTEESSGTPGAQFVKDPKRPLCVWVLLEMLEIFSATSRIRAFDLLVKVSCMAQRIATADRSLAIRKELHLLLAELLLRLHWLDDKRASVRQAALDALLYFCAPQPHVHHCIALPVLVDLLQQSVGVNSLVNCTVVNRLAQLLVAWLYTNEKLDTSLLESAGGVSVIYNLYSSIESEECMSAAENLFVVLYDYIFSGGSNHESRQLLELLLTSYAPWHLRICTLHTQVGPFVNQLVAFVKVHRANVERASDEQDIVLRARQFGRLFIDLVHAQGTQQYGETNNDLYGSSAGTRMLLYSHVPHERRAGEHLLLNALVDDDTSQWAQALLERLLRTSWPSARQSYTRVARKLLWHNLMGRPYNTPPRMHHLLHYWNVCVDDDHGFTEIQLKCTSRDLMHVLATALEAHCVQRTVRV
eukprot:COSAG05_NODE_41_length_26845_cov_26.599230_14_plen_648_part_00